MTDLSEQLKLPLGWDAQVDTRTGKTYFINHVTKKSQWEDPRLQHPSIWNTNRLQLVRSLHEAFPEASEQYIRYTLVHTARNGHFNEFAAAEHLSQVAVTEQQRLKSKQKTTQQQHTPQTKKQKPAHKKCTADAFERMYFEANFPHIPVNVINEVLVSCNNDRDKSHEKLAAMDPEEIVSHHNRLIDEQQTLSSPKFAQCISPNIPQSLKSTAETQPTVLTDSNINVDSSRLRDTTLPVTNLKQCPDATKTSVGNAVSLPAVNKAETDTQPITASIKLAEDESVLTTVKAQKDSVAECPSSEVTRTPTPRSSSLAKGPCKDHHRGPDSINVCGASKKVIGPTSCLQLCKRQVIRGPDSSQRCGAVPQLARGPACSATL